MKTKKRTSSTPKTIKHNGVKIRQLPKTKIEEAYHNLVYALTETDDNLKLLESQKIYVLKATAVDELDKLIKEFVMAHQRNNEIILHGRTFCKSNHTVSDDGATLMVRDATYRTVIKLG